MGSSSLRLFSRWGRLRRARKRPRNPPQLRNAIELADVNWAFQLSRRWTLIRTPKAKFFLGFGGTYKTEEDILNGSHWNFAEQAGVRLTGSNAGPGIEFAVRHISNAGIRLPNKGEDFVTLVYVF